MFLREADEAFKAHARTCVTCRYRFPLCDEGMNLLRDFYAALNQPATPITKGEIMAGTAIEIVPPSALKKPHSFRVGVKTKTSQAAWVFNGLRFPDQDSAVAYAEALHHRWADVMDYLIEESDEHANCSYPVPSDRYQVPRQGA